MTILEIFKTKARNKTANIGIGLGDKEEHNIKILNASIEFLNEYDSTMFIFGNEDAIEQIKSHRISEKITKNINLINSKEPEQEIVNFLKNNTIDAIVRGCISSSKFLNNLKNNLGISEINRLALLETYDGYQFLYGPVGIDECNDIQSKISFVKKAIKQLKYLEIEPKISVLSGGRIGDVGRNAQVDKSINFAEELVDYFKNQYLNLNINHDEILIENSIQNKSNVIIAPDGISGNLIYRTLVHLGGGKAYGAIYMDIDRVIIDTSRVGNISEIQGALLLALALTS
jgi:putative methanogen marker protein 4